MLRAKSLQLCLTLCDPMYCNPPGSSVLGILQARILEWVAMPSSKGSSWPRDWTYISYILLHSQESSLPLAPPGKPSGKNTFGFIFYSNWCLHAKDPKNIHVDKGNWVYYLLKQRTPPHVRSHGDVYSFLCLYSTFVSSLLLDMITSHLFCCYIYVISMSHSVLVRYLFSVKLLMSVWEPHEYLKAVRPATSIYLSGKIISFSFSTLKKVLLC